MVIGADLLRIGSVATSVGLTTLTALRAASYAARIRHHLSEDAYWRIRVVGWLSMTTGALCVLPWALGLDAVLEEMSAIVLSASILTGSIALVFVGALGHRLITKTIDEALEGTPLVDAHPEARGVGGFMAGLLCIAAGIGTFGIGFLVGFPALLFVLFLREFAVARPHLNALIEAYEPLTARTSPGCSAAGTHRTPV